MQFNNLGKQWDLIRDSILEKIDILGFEGSYINGKAVSEFEQQFASYFGSKFAVGVSNGTDGLKLALQTFDLTQYDAVVIPANTYIADYIAVKNLPIKSQPKVILIDHDENFVMDTDQLEKLMFNRNKPGYYMKYNKMVVIPVHLYGHCCDMDKIADLSIKYNFSILEDCSQSHGTRYKGNHLGSYGDISVYSLYPGKNLGALGDAGIITTNDESIYNRLKSLRNYGSSIKYHYDEIGNNHRLDSIQAIILSEKLKYLNKWTYIKSKIAYRFLDEIKNDKVILPKVSKDCYHSWHIFCLVVDDRTKFESYLSDNLIPTIIHYPIPIHKTKIFDPTDIVFSKSNTDKYADKIISIPIHPFLSDDEVNHIINVINKY